MESNWRRNVFLLIGNSYSRFQEPGGFPTGYTHLVAELNPHILQGGKVWSHLLKYREGNGNLRVVFGRLDGSNVINEVRDVPRFLPRFPYGYSVEPD